MWLVVREAAWLKIGPQKLSRMDSTAWVKTSDNDKQTSRMLSAVWKELVNVGQLILSMIIALYGALIVWIIALQI